VGLKPILRTTTSFSALTLSVGSFDPTDSVKAVPDMTYNVFSGTLNPTQSITGRPRRPMSESTCLAYVRINSLRVDAVIHRHVVERPLNHSTFTPVRVCNIHRLINYTQ